MEGSYMGKQDDALDFTFLEQGQIFGENQLKILKIYGTRCAITDFAILLGGYVSSNSYTSEGNSLKNRTGWWWAKSSDGDNNAQAVDYNGRRRCIYVHHRAVGARPALPYSFISSIISNRVRGIDNLLEIEYGEYPQWVVTENESNVLEGLFRNHNLKVTGKSYTTDSILLQEINTRFQGRTHVEYEYNGCKYIRFVADPNSFAETISDGRKVKVGKPYWIRVEPVKWIVDEETGIALSKYILFSGVQFHYECNYVGDFNTTDIKKFMDQGFAKDIIPSKISRIEIPNQQSNCPELDKFMNISDTNKEEIIMSLVLGKTPNGNCYTASMIAQILAMPPKEVRDIIKKNLIIYRKKIKQDYRNLNRAIDTIIVEATKKPTIIEKILKK